MHKEAKTMQSKAQVDKPEDRIARLEKELEALKAIMRRNGWTVGE